MIETELDPNGNKYKREITTETMKTLMSLSGGACAICGNPLLCEPERDNDKYKHIGEIAHIIGLKPNSKRHDKTKTSAQLNSIDNLIILCPTCHRKIDKTDDFSVKNLLEKKKIHESETIKSINNIVNRTKQGGHTDIGNCIGLKKFIFEDEVDENDWKYTRRLIQSLNDLSLSVRSALLDLSTEVVIHNNNRKLKYSYWYDAYRDDLEKIIDPLYREKYIDIDDWTEGYDKDPELIFDECWKMILDFLKQNNVPFDKVIILRDYNVFD